MTAPVSIMLTSNDIFELELLPAVGGRIHRLRAWGIDLLRTPHDVTRHAEDPTRWGSYPMVPWCNRIPQGQLTFADAVVALPVAADGHAIHGEAFDRPWTLIDDLTLQFHGGIGTFPWPYLATQRFALEGARFTLALEMTNTGAAPCPAGLGIHPWFTSAGGLEVEVPADRAYPSRDGIAVGEPQPVTGDGDLRRLGAVPWGTDTVYTGLLDQAVLLEWPTAGLRAHLSFGASADHVVVAAFEELAAVAVEPQTHASDGHGRFARGESGAIVILEPGQTLAVQYVLEVSRFSAAPTPL